MPWVNYDAPPDTPEPPFFRRIPTHWSVIYIVHGFEEGRANDLGEY